MSRVIVHIGLPKTATTSLQQDLFPRLVDESLLYLGVKQPRTSHEQCQMFTNFYQAVIGTGGGGVRQRIGEQLAAGRSVLVSEELLTVSQKGLSWREKLKSLSTLLGDFEYKILVTVREPVTALFSFYVELYPWFSKQGSFVNCALNDDYMRIYHYGELTDTLVKIFGKEKILVCRFEDIVAGNIAALVKMINPRFSSCNTLTLGRQNSRLSEGNRIITHHNFSLVDLVRYPYRKFGLDKLGFVALLKNAAEPVTKMLRRASIAHVSVPRPTSDDMELIRDRLRPENLIMKREFQVGYD
ncbi:MAG: hypothetical protein C0613_10735 [Desulfobulbaceae bacterium]|nr:MAG: hypothetical protein C0613_10735 [Desulfobulbaceae bacterium]